jgi:outer membrane lipoprotein LolB
MYRNKLNVRLFVLALAALLQACAPSGLLHIDNKLWLQHQQRVSVFDTWSLRASIAANTKDDGINARLYWQQQQQSYQLRLHGPLGQGTLLIDGKPGHVTLRSGDGQRRHAATPEALLSLVAADIPPLPLTAMRDWIRGLPDSRYPTTTQRFNPDGSLAYLEQNGWQVDYGAYITVNGVNLPRKISLKNTELRAKLAISQWQLGRQE